ncbi:MAG: alpha-hydroxy acid oxidase [Rhodospirillales bacterium]
MSADYVSNQEIIQAAYRNLSRNVWDYLVGAAESETTLRRNRVALDSLAFLPRVLRDVEKVDPSTTFMGHRLRIPVFMAPVGSLQTIIPGGAAPVTKAAHAFGTINFVSSVTDPPLEETASLTPHPKVFQLYVRGDMKWIEELLDRVKAAGYAGLCLTVDAAYYGIRERQLMNRWLPPSVQRETNRHLQAKLTWDSMAHIKEYCGLPFVLKGVATAADAKLAVEHGVDVVYVSNHGGRELDHGRGTMQMLPEIVDAVAGRAEIAVDGGILRGTDVLKALCLGATAVGIGRLQGWALAAGGEAALVRALELVEREVVNAMGLIGVTSVGQLGRDYVCGTEPVGPCHEMSTFTHMPGGRLF